MYEKFYGFKEKPFTLLPDPSFLYFGKQHSTAYSILEYGLVNRADFTVITGEIGSGKTTLIRHLLDQADKDINVGLLSSSHPEMGELLRWVLLSFGLDYQDKDRVALHDRFTRFLIDQYAQNKRAVLIIDEAQNLDSGVLEELRLLSNINADKNQVLQIVLVGQPELRQLLKQPKFLQLLQRVSVDYHLTGLSEKETKKYICHRVRCAGRKKPLFTVRACSLIHFASKGIPRVINTLCDMVLVYGFVDRMSHIESKLVEDVLAEKADSGLFQYDIPKEEGGSTESDQPGGVKPVALKSMNGSTIEERGTVSPVKLDSKGAKQLFSSSYGTKGKNKIQ